MGYDVVDQLRRFNISRFPAHRAQWMFPQESLTCIAPSAAVPARSCASTLLLIIRVVSPRQMLLAISSAAQVCAARMLARLFRRHRHTSILARELRARFVDGFRRIFPNNAHLSHTGQTDHTCGIPVCILRQQFLNLITGLTYRTIHPSHLQSIKKADSSSACR